jgi:hypothetical protein
MNGEDVQLVEEIARLDRPAADGDHTRLPAVGHLAGEPGLELAKRCFSLLLEQLPDRPLGPLDLLVHVVERPVQPQRHLPAERRLAGAHEANQREMPT